VDVPARFRGLGAELQAINPDDRDTWIDNKLGFDPPPPDNELPRGGVPYLPAPVDAIAEIVREAPVGPNDTLVDIGCGLGRVVIVGHLLSGARGIGLDVQKHLVARAKETVVGLGLEGVTFIQGDAGDVEVDGTVYFMYAPCNGALLARVLAHMETVSKRHPITICTMDLELDFVPWLYECPMTEFLQIYRSVTTFKTIRYGDGSANAYRFEADGRFEYTPVTPERSSTGMYSGGDPRSGTLDEAQRADLWNRVQALAANSALHVEDRAKGTGAFHIADASGTRSFIVKRGPELAAWDDFVQHLGH